METKKLENLETQARQTADQKDPFTPEPEKTKNKGGRPPGSKNKKPGQEAKGPNDQPKSGEPKPEPIRIPTAFVVAPCVDMYSLACVNIAGHTKAGLGPQEKEALTAATVNCVDYYFPNYMTAYGPIIALGAVLGSHLVRVAAIRKLVQSGEVESDTRPKPRPVVETQPPKPAPTQAETVDSAFKESVKTFEPDPIMN